MCRRAVPGNSEENDTRWAYRKKLLVFTPFCPISYSKTNHIGHIQKNSRPMPRYFEKAGQQTAKIFYMPI